MCMTRMKTYLMFAHGANGHHQLHFQFFQLLLTTGGAGSRVGGRSSCGRRSFVAGVVGFLLVFLLLFARLWHATLRRRGQHGQTTTTSSSTSTVLLLLASKRETLITVAVLRRRHASEGATRRRPDADQRWDPCGLRCQTTLVRRAPLPPQLHLLYLRCPPENKHKIHIEHTLKNNFSLLLHLYFRQCFFCC